MATSNGEPSQPRLAEAVRPLGLFIQPACLQHRYIRHANASHIFERPERLRAVLLGVAAGVARVEQAEAAVASALPSAASRPEGDAPVDGPGDSPGGAVATATNGPMAPSAPQGAHGAAPPVRPSRSAPDDLSSLLSALSVNSPFAHPRHLKIVPPPVAGQPGQVLLHHPALQLSHSPPPDAPFPFLGQTSEPGAASASVSGGTPGAARLDSPAKTNSPLRARTQAGPSAPPSSTYLQNLYKWASESVERIKETGCEIPAGLGLNQGDLYLAPGSILAIEGAIQTVCQAIDRVCAGLPSPRASPSQPGPPQTPPSRLTPSYSSPNVSAIPASSSSTRPDDAFSKAFCCIRPPGHHCGEDTPSGFCYVNNVVVGAMHAYLEHDIDRAIVIDFDLHHGNGTQALMMPLNAVSHAEDLAQAGGKPPSGLKGKDGRPRRGWKGFYGSVHDIYSYPCEDGDLELYIENIHLQPYSDEADFYAQIYPKYLALLDKARFFMRETKAEPSKTVVLISAGFDACEHEHRGMQRHDRRVPTSFFGRYTRDIVRFAEEHAEGKVVSVLEGGYSDKALMSAAMGHVIGLLDEKGESDWWSETELANIEKATKKRRTGKLAPFPPELSAVPYLLRTHALLGHFEGLGPDPTLHGTPTSVAPSIMATPQPASRMTLRNRSALPTSASIPGSDDGGLSASGSTGSVGLSVSGAQEELLDTVSAIPTTAARRGRGRGTATPAATPRKVTVGATPLRKQAAHAQALAQGAPPPPQAIPLLKVATPSKIPLPPSEKNTPVRSSVVKTEEPVGVKMEPQLSSDELADVSMVLSSTASTEENETPSKPHRSVPSVPVSSLMSTPQKMVQKAQVTPQRIAAPSFGSTDPPYNPLASRVPPNQATQQASVDRDEGMQTLGTAPGVPASGIEGGVASAASGEGQKIFLRIRRPTPVGTQIPALPAGETGAEGQGKEEDDRMEADMDWREASAETTTSTGTEGEYQSARTGTSSD